MPSARGYAVHSIFGPTIQGEASMAGLPVVFLRLSLCNMWSGRLEDRESSGCPFCDTDFYDREWVGLDDLVDRLASAAGGSTRWVWISGGEPLIQIDEPLLAALGGRGLFVGVETNGTLEIPPLVRARINHLVVSPKRVPGETLVEGANDLKLLFPHPAPGMEPHRWSEYPASRRWLQPVWDDSYEENLARAIEAITSGDLPGWRLSVQTHKYIGVE